MRKQTNQRGYNDDGTAVVTVRDLARLWPGVSRRTRYRLANEIGVRVGRRLLISRRRLQRFLDGREES